MKETDWFSLTVLPVRVGVYKTRHRGTDLKIYEGYSFWSGRGWEYTHPTPFKPSKFNYASSQQSREWKGIYKETS
jgi:hypothetical protein